MLVDHEKVCATIAQRIETHEQYAERQWRLMCEAREKKAQAANYLPTVDSHRLLYKMFQLRLGKNR